MDKRWLMTFRYAENVSRSYRRNASAALLLAMANSKAAPSVVVASRSNKTAALAYSFIAEVKCFVSSVASVDAIK